MPPGSSRPFVEPKGSEHPGRKGHGRKGLGEESPLLAGHKVRPLGGIVTSCPGTAPAPDSGGGPISLRNVTRPIACCICLGILKSC